MPDNASIVVCEVEIFDSEDGQFEPLCECICRKKAESLVGRKGLDYLFALGIVDSYDLSPGDLIRVHFRVLNRPRYKLPFEFADEYLGSYRVSVCGDGLCFSCLSFKDTQILGGD